MSLLPNGITFKVSSKELEPPNDSTLLTITDLMKKHSLVTKRGGKLLFTTQSHPSTVLIPFNNVFAGTCLMAYNEHFHLQLSPDHVWLSITTALANYIDKHAEEMRHVFVDHDGKKEITVYGGGSIMSANYDALIGAISDEVDKNTKNDLRSWLECDFSTSTRLSRTVSKLVLMGAMKNYFSYKMCLRCGLPRVTLLGTLEDWRSVRQRVDRLATWNVPELRAWSEVLGYVLDRFVETYERVSRGDSPDADFWNRIAHRTGGGSGPRYLEGWVLAFIPFDDKGKYVLNDLDSIKSSNSFGRMNTNNVPPTGVEVPVTIDDNGREYKTIFYAGALAAALTTTEEQQTLTPTLDWALVDMTNPVVTDT